MLVHLHETLSPDIDLLQDILLHSNIVLLMVSEKGTVGTDTLLAVNTDDFNLALMHWAHISSIFHNLGNSRI
jgi:hypothetical protein